MCIIGNSNATYGDRHTEHVVLGASFIMSQTLKLSCFISIVRVCSVYLCRYLVCFLLHITWLPLQVQEPKVRLHCWLSKGKQETSTTHVLFVIAGASHVISPVQRNTTLVSGGPDESSSSALRTRKQAGQILYMYIFPVVFFKIWQLDCTECLLYDNNATAACMHDEKI